MRYSPDLHFWADFYSDDKFLQLGACGSAAGVHVLPLLEIGQVDSETCVWGDACVVVNTATGLSLYEAPTWQCMYSRAGSKAVISGVRNIFKISRDKVLSRHPVLGWQITDGLPIRCCHSFNGRVVAQHPYLDLLAHGSCVADDAEVITGLSLEISSSFGNVNAEFELEEPFDDHDGLDTVFGFAQWAEDGLSLHVCATFGHCNLYLGKVKCQTLTS